MNMIELTPRFKDKEINILQFFSLYSKRIENQNLLGLPALIQEINSHTNNKPLPQFEFFNLGRQAMRFLGDRFLPKASLARMMPTTY